MVQDRVSIPPGTAVDLAGVAALETGPDTARWLGETGLSLRRVRSRPSGFGSRSPAGRDT